MSFLISVILAIALGAAMTTTWLNYVPIKAIMDHHVTVVAEKGMESLIGSSTRYLEANVDGNGNPIYPGDGQSVASAISPAYGYMPPSKYGLGWMVRTDTHQGLPSIGICLTVPPKYVDTLPHVISALPQGSTTQGTQCNAATHNASGTALTYWLPLSHV